MVRFFKKHWLIVLIVLVAGFLRFFGLTQRGLVVSDACFYGNLAKTPIYALDFFQNGGSISNMNGLLEYLKGNGCVFNSEKPAHTFLIFISFLVFGIKDWAVLLVSALCGVISVLMVYLIAVRFFTKEVGIIAATLLAFSGLMVAFSRTGYPQMGTMLMVATVLYFYFSYNRDRQRKHLYLAAISTGIALLFHPTFVIVLFPIVVHFFFDYIGNGKKRPAPLAIMASVLLIAFPILLEEGVSALANMLSNEYEISGVILQFFHTSDKLAVSNQSADFLSGLRFFFEMIRMTDGQFWTLFFVWALLFGTFKGVREKNSYICILAGQVILSLALWSWKYPTVKVLPVCYPALSLLAGYSVWEMFSKSGFKKAGVVVSMALIVVSVNYAYLKSQLTLAPSFRQAIRMTKEIVERDGGVFCATDQGALKPILNFYMPQIKKGRFGIEFKGSKSETVSYEMLGFGRMVTEHDYSESLFENCQIVLELRNYDHLIPVTNFHRLKNEGLEYIKANFNERWLNLYLFRKCDNQMKDVGIRNLLEGRSLERYYFK